MKTIELTAEQYEALQQGESITIQPPKPKPKPKPEQWEPKGGCWWVGPDCKVHHGRIENTSRLAGIEFQTKEAAKEAAKAQKEAQIIRAYIYEHRGDWRPDWNDFDQGKYSVFYNNRTKRWVSSRCWTSEVMGVTYGPESVIRELVEKLNAGLIRGIE